MDHKELTEQLEGLKSDLQTEQKQLTEKAKKEIGDQIKAIEDNLKTIEGKIPTKQVDEIKASIEEVKTSFTELKEWRVIKDERDLKTEEAVDKMIAEKQTKPIGEAPTASFQSVLNEALTTGDGFEKLKKIAENAPKREKRFTIELKLPGTITVGNVTGTVWSNVIRPGIIEIPKRKVHVRDLVPVGTIGPGTQFVYMRENGVGEGEIATVAEGNTKAQFDLDLIEAAVNIETIAGFLVVTRKAMNNIPGFLSFLNSRLPELFLRAEDAQLISGNGTSPNISGILDTGNFTAAEDSATVLAERLIDALSQLEDEHERNANGILLRPVNYYSFFKNKAEGSGEYDLPQNVVFAGDTLRISGVPVYASTAVPNGTYIVGDFQMGAQLLIQEGMRIEFFEQDDVNVRKNLITVRIEGTEAFPIYGDNYFIAGTTPAGSS